ncbi:MAG: peptidoglycan-binding protein [Clostridia bacterium]|nr:peptidoglycan-binding protein [Clostridia bacterium]
MYRITDTPSAIKEVQKYLSSYSEDAKFIPPSGVYDDVTRVAVTKFQDEFGIEPSGIVDYLTFITLYDNYIRTLRAHEVSEALDSLIIFPLVRGTKNQTVRQINHIMGRLLDYYGVIHSLINTSVFTEETERAVIALREIYAMERLGIIDEEFFRRISLDHDSIYDFSV